LVTVVCAVALPSLSNFQEGSTSFVLNAAEMLATAILLTTEIDAATLSGRNTNELVSGFAQISSRMLERAQSAELGF
jgi:hypothetical protein